MEMQLLNPIVKSVYRPTDEQMRWIDFIAHGESPIDDLIEVATNELTPIAVRGWCWNLLFLATLPAWLYRQDREWMVTLPVPMVAQSVTVNDLINSPRGGKPKFFGRISQIPHDSLEQVWELLSLRIDTDIRYASSDDWGNHVIAGTLKMCCIQSPGSSYYRKTLEAIQESDQELFELVWELIINPDVPDWVRRNFIQLLLRVGPEKLPDGCSFTTGLGNSHLGGKHSATARFVHNIIRGDKKWSSEIELCVEEFFDWLWRTDQSVPLIILARYGIFKQDVLKLLYRVNPEAFWKTLWIMLTETLTNPEEDRVAKEFTPQDLQEGFLFSMRSLAAYSGNGKLIAKIDELLLDKQEAKRAQQESLHEHELEQIEEGKVRDEGLALSRKARFMLVNDLVEEPITPG